MDIQLKIEAAHLLAVFFRSMAILGGLAVLLSVSPKQIRDVMAALGRRKSEKKAQAARNNGRLGGRPKKIVKVLDGHTA